MSKRFFILGYYGWRNTGDDAMAYSILYNLESSYPGSFYTLLSNNPLEIPRSLKKSVKYVGSKAKLRVLKEIKDSSIFILGGGTHLFDYGKRRRHIVRLTQMLILLIWAKIFCEKIYFLGVGVEAPHTIEGKLLIKLICRLADFIWVRDTHSYSLLQKWGMEYKIKQSSDLAMSLDAVPKTASPLVNEDTRILGISLLPFFEIYYEDRNKDQLFLQRIASALIRWLNEDKRNSIRIFVFKDESKDDDATFSKDLFMLLNVPGRAELIPYEPNPLEMLGKVGECHMFIGMRYHSCVFAYLTNLPLLVIDYAEKNRALAEDIGLTTNSLLSPIQVLAGEFDIYLKNLTDHPERFNASIPVEFMRNRSWPL